MRTVFINGLMPDRSRAFIRALCREFQVVGTGYGMLNDDPEIMVHEPCARGAVYKEKQKGLR